MPKSRKAINADHYQRKELAKGRGMARKTRSQKKTLSKNSKAVSGRLCYRVKKSEGFVANANLEQHGWQVFKGVWTKNEALAAAKNVLKVSENLDREKVAIRNDRNRIVVYGVGDLHKQRAVEKTQARVTGHV